MDVKALLAKITNDFHIPVAVFVFASTTVYHFWTKQDLGANYVEAIKYMYLFLTGHFTASQVWPDKTGGQQ